MQMVKGVFVRLKGPECALAHKLREDRDAVKSADPDGLTGAAPRKCAAMERAETDSRRAGLQEVVIQVAENFAGRLPEKRS